MTDYLSANENVSLDVVALTRRAQLYALASHFDEAVADLNAVIELAPYSEYAEDAQRYLTQIRSQLDSLDSTPESTPAS
jgi:outer membrane protein assembly factor BamD (BamD/ComL family)